MEDINSVILTGELAGDATFYRTPRGTSVAHFTLSFSSAISGSKRSTRSGGMIRVAFLEAEARRWEFVLKKGERVLVKGRLQQRRWKTPEGIERSQTEIIAHQVEALHGANGKQEG